MIAFVDRLDVFESDEVKEDYKDFDFGSIDYGTEQSIKNSVKEDANGFEVAAEMIRICKGVDIKEQPFLEWIGTANFFLSNLISSIYVLPSLEKINQIMSKLKPGSADYKNLEVLQRTYQSQELES